MFSRSGSPNLGSEDFVCCCLMSHQQYFSYIMKAHNEVFTLWPAAGHPFHWQLLFFYVPSQSITQGCKRGESILASFPLLMSCMILTSWFSSPFVTIQWRFWCPCYAVGIRAWAWAWGGGCSVITTYLHPPPSPACPAWYSPVGPPHFRYHSVSTLMSLLCFGH